MDILNLPQFEKVVVTRKNAKDCVLKEEERVIRELSQLKKEGKVSEELFEQLRPTGSQPPRLYGLAKVHKIGVPVRPVLSMPGSPYHPTARKVAEWLSVVPEAQINSSSKQVSDKTRTVRLEDDEVMVSFDVVSLYTHVPVKESIQCAADLLYAGDLKTPPVDKETFVRLAELSSVNVIMSTHDGYYRQRDGLAMGSPSAPHLANVWLQKHEPIIKDDAKMYERYMDDILRSIKKNRVESKLAEINNLHPSLKFTIENEQSGKLPLLDMCIVHTGNCIHATLAPRKYTRSVVQGFVHRIHRACSDWSYFHDGVGQVKKILERNQYPPEFYEPIIATTIEKLAAPSPPLLSSSPVTLENVESSSLQIRLQYRGRATDSVVKKLSSFETPVKTVVTLRKLKTVLPSLKPPVPKPLRSCVVYQI